MLPTICKYCDTIDFCFKTCWLVGTSRVVSRFPVEGISCHQPLVWLHLISIEKFSPFTVTFCAWITKLGGVVLRRDPIHNQFGLPMFGESSASVEKSLHWSNFFWRYFSTVADLQKWTRGVNFSKIF